MALSDDMQLLSSLALFQGLEPDQLRLIAFGAEHRPIGQGQPLFREHSPAECAYVVVRGRFELSNTGRDGKPQVAAVAGPGTMLSELALATMVERKYTAIALEDSEVLRIPRPLFHRLLEEYPQLGLVMQERIRQNLMALATGAKGMEERFR
ncbi:cyclic nucleotide-binding domain-containing protein [Agrobacterium vitis]|uniref:Cyclic nucleotide-binding domain-containing protein n=1 Tax=Agrobacterium vitis TaxID=373 RepID=A0A1S2E850_AGRVI|nr:cyclic nucleotide-binding domain-containing protein [Agrobacterium vitis]MUO79649.1 cyclic nucleotide-binding domain-containing protein [Agrobacterium vitis]MUO96801.1 cyclic nucleotide-binding domain-containing protein [Agrobacterium vitis]MUP07738.1 cyclic nucleotide-binding domain-containing protein [Agrobacterium vitis]MUZ72500.1 cyclic nucleotide-binding domain-containing protein [Agrobacterium vitis]MUZ83578.1 cyclic nucleotide-binding domain-containing protein [Agrobacterium vitis]